MLNQETRTIGGKRYTVTVLGAEKGRRTLVRLLKLLGPSLAAALRGLGPKDEIVLGGSTMADAITDLCLRLTEEDLEYLVSTFRGSTTVTLDAGGEIPLDRLKGTEFAGDYGSLLEWLAFSIELNYSSFLAGLRPTALPQ